MSADLIGTIVGFILTCLIFSYLLGDNGLYRLALHLFIGALIGYTFGIILDSILIEMVVMSLSDNPLLLVPLVLGLWLFVFKSIPRLAYVGNFSIAFLVGVGAAVAMSGALIGTLVPQMEATAQAMRVDLLNIPALVQGGIVVVGTICTLMAFNVTFVPSEKTGLVKLWAQLIGAVAWVGRWFLVVALGVAFAAGLTTSLSILIGRIQFLINAVTETF